MKIIIALIAVIIGCLLFCVCAVGGTLVLNAVGFYGNPYIEKADSAYTTVEINAVISGKLNHEANPDAEYMDHIGAYGYVGGIRRNLLGIVWVKVYGDPALDGYYFDCGLNKNEQADGLEVGDYVYLKGQVGGNGKSATIWDEYMTIVYCYITRAD
jgi:hypothetical protein